METGLAEYLREGCLDGRMEGVFLQKEINDLGGKQRQKHAHTDEHKEYEMFAHCSCLIISRRANLAIRGCNLLTINNGNVV